MELLDLLDAVQEVRCQLVFLSASVVPMLAEAEVEEAVGHGLQLILDRLADDLQKAIEAQLQRAGQG